MTRRSLLPDGWNDAAQAALERHAAAGLSARQAAARLRITKNAAISRGARTGVTFAPDPALISDLCAKAGRASAAARQARKADTHG